MLDSFRACLCLGNPADAGPAPYGDEWAPLPHGDPATLCPGSGRQRLPSRPQEQQTKGLLGRNPAPPQTCRAPPPHRSPKQRRFPRPPCTPTWRHFGERPPGVLSGSGERAHPRPGARGILGEWPGAVAAVAPLRAREVCAPPPAAPALTPPLPPPAAQLGAALAPRRHRHRHRRRRRAASRRRASPPLAPPRRGASMRLY